LTRRVIRNLVRSEIVISQLGYAISSQRQRRELIVERRDQNRYRRQFTVGQTETGDGGWKIIEQSGVDGRVHVVSGQDETLQEFEISERARDEISHVVIFQIQAFQIFQSRNLTEWKRGQLSRTESQRCERVLQSGEGLIVDSGNGDFADTQIGQTGEFIENVIRQSDRLAAVFDAQTQQTQLT